MHIITTHSVRDPDNEPLPIIYWHPPFEDSPDILIPVRLSLLAPIPLNEPEKSPALVDACAAFALGCLPETERALRAVVLRDLGPGDRWIATELRLRVLAVHGDWKGAANHLNASWPWFLAAMRTGMNRPRMINVAAAVIAQGANHHSLALEISRFLTLIAPNPRYAFYQTACVEAHFRRPAQAAKALWKACFIHKLPEPVGMLLWDADLRKMFEYFAVFPPGEKSYEYLTGALGNLEKMVVPYGPSWLDLATFRAMPREFVELFSFDPVHVIYEVLPVTEKTDRDLARRYLEWQFEWWQEGIRLALNTFRPPSAPYITKEDFAKSSARIETAAPTT